MRNLAFLFLFVLVEIQNSYEYPLSTSSICFEECRCLNRNNRSLEVSKCLSTFSFNSRFDNVPWSLTAIQFNDITITNLRKNAFERFEDLDTLQFNNSIIKEMDAEAFAPNMLASLYFINCKFDNTPYIKSQDLEELLIINSNLRKVPKFYPIQYLTLLNLEGNKISAVKEKSFAVLEGLEDLNLSNNELVTLPPKLFYNNTQLMTLDLRNNSLRSFIFEGSANLETLWLSSNKLIVFDVNSSKNLRSLRSLYLRNNELTEITFQTLSNMPSLELIDLSYNRLSKLESNIFAHNLNLEKVFLDGNNLKTMPVFHTNNIFGGLYYFSCKNCGLVKIKANTFSKMPSLNQINLSDNDLTMIDPLAFSDVTSLNTIDLSNNKLTSLGKSTFGENKLLADINLSGNPLGTLSVNDFIDLANLRSLNVSNCNLTQLWSDNYKYKLQELDQLIISNNSIDVITQEDLKVVPNLKVIDLENNPLKCTRHLALIIKWLTLNKVYSIESAMYLRTNEKLSDDAAVFGISFDHKFYWKKLAVKACRPTDNEMENINREYVLELIIQDEKEMIVNVPIVRAPHLIDSDDVSEEEDEDEIEQDEIYEDQVKESFNLSQATYIISITSVFVFTALVVLTAAVTTTLIILRRNQAFSKANIPTLNIKIPRWENNLSLKKHSGSIYRPLSEEITPQTPKINRYEFKAQPAVHSNINV